MGYFERRFENFDWVIFTSVCFLVVIGLFCHYSITYQQPSAANFYKQIVWFLLGLVVLFIFYYLPTKLIQDLSYFIYGLSLFFLILVLVVGKVKYGAERWLSVGLIDFQPSELTKIASIAAVGQFLSRDQADLSRPKDILISVSFLVIPILFILKQPDLGTAITFVAIALPILFWGGISWFLVFAVITPIFTMVSAFNIYSFFIVMSLISIILYFSKRPFIILIVIFLINIILGSLTEPIWNRLHPYQQRRIVTFLNPESDPKGSGYQVIQSQVAVGSGGLTGKGFLKGTQTQLRFLPEQHTDFVFSVVGEEFGFFGSLTVIFLFAAIIIKGIQVAYQSKNRFRSLVSIGISSLLFFHVSINIGMSVGLMPVTGIPLPLLSYGGTSLLMNMMMMGMLISISAKRNEY